MQPEQQIVATLGKPAAQLQGTSVIVHSSATAPISSTEPNDLNANQQPLAQQPQVAANNDPYLFKYFGFEFDKNPTSDICCCDAREQDADPNGARGSTTGFVATICNVATKWIVYFTVLTTLAVGIIFIVLFVKANAGQSILIAGIICLLFCTCCCCLWCCLMCSDWCTMSNVFYPMGTRDITCSCGLVLSCAMVLCCPWFVFH